MTQEELLAYVLKGHQSATKLVNDLATVSQVWDDLIDDDKLTGKGRITDAFVILLSDIPRNQFYIEYFSELQPMIEAAMIDWLTANELEKAPEFRRVSYVIRDNLSAVLICCAKIIGGMAWAIEVSETVRRFTHDEDFEEYCNGQHERT